MRGRCRDGKVVRMQVMLFWACCVHLPRKVVLVQRKRRHGDLTGKGKRNRRDENCREESRYRVKAGFDHCSINLLVLDAALQLSIAARTRHHKIKIVVLFARIIALGHPQSIMILNKVFLRGQSDSKENVPAPK